MKPNTDFEFVRRILEKCERGEVLDAEERKYGEIFESLKSKSQKSVKMDADFHESLKRELMETYSELYPESQKGYFVFPKIPKLFF